jgi:hypothetical protein
MSDPALRKRQQLAAELAELTRQQHEAMKFASLFRMTDEEARAYDERHERIKELCEALHVPANAA